MPGSAAPTWANILRQLRWRRNRCSSLNRPANRQHANAPSDWSGPGLPRNHWRNAGAVADFWQVIADQLSQAGVRHQLMATSLGGNRRKPD